MHSSYIINSASNKKKKSPFRYTTSLFRGTSGRSFANIITSPSRVRRLGDYLFGHGFEALSYFLVIKKGIHSNKVPALLFLKFFFIAEMHNFHILADYFLIEFIDFTLQFLGCCSFLPQFLFQAFLVLLELELFFYKCPIQILLSL